MPLARLELGGRVGDQVFSAIHTAILRGELRAGARLRIRDLADELGTSVMPVREAIRRLEEIGLVEMVRMLWHRCRSYKSLGAEQALDSGDPTALLTYQQQLYRAITDGDVEEAGRITAESLDAAMGRIRSSMQMS